MRASNSDIATQFRDTRTALIKWQRFQSDKDLKACAQVIISNLDGLVRDPTDTALLQIFPQNAVCFAEAVRSSPNAKRITLRAKKQYRGRANALTEVVHCGPLIAGSISSALLSLIDKAIPRHIKGSDRDDIAQEIALARVGGSISDEEIVQGSSAVRASIRKHFGLHPRNYGPRSLDAPLGVGMGTLHDLISHSGEAND